MKISRAKLRRRAWDMVRDEKRRGKLPRPSELACIDCGKPACSYDHRDYTKPLSVDAVCHSCNLLRGPGYPSKRGGLVRIPETMRPGIYAAKSQSGTAERFSMRVTPSFKKLFCELAEQRGQTMTAVMETLVLAADGQPFIQPQ